MDISHHALIFESFQSPGVPPRAVLPSILFSSATRLLLNTPPQLVFDQFTRLTARILRVPVSLVLGIDRDRQFFKNFLGLPEPVDSRRETPLTHSFRLHVRQRAELTDPPRLGP